jgi:flagellar export protein FliJ
VAKFKFKLESVLKVRSSQEKKALTEMSIHQKNYQNEFDKKSKLFDKLKKTISYDQNVFEENMPTYYLSLRDNYISKIKSELTKADQSLLVAKKKLEKSLSNYYLARSNHEIMETMKKENFEIFKKEISKKDQKDSEELTVSKFIDSNKKRIKIEL